NQRSSVGFFYSRKISAGPSGTFATISAIRRPEQVQQIEALSRPCTGYRPAGQALALRTWIFKPKAPKAISRSRIVPLRSKSAMGGMFLKQHRQKQRYPSDKEDRL